MSGTVARRRALVTGGASGIGAAIARRLHADGRAVAILDVSDERIEAFTRETGIEGHRCDVSDPDAIARAFETLDASGGVDILVNNAGITRDSMLHKMPAHHWDQVIAVDLSSVFHTTRLAVPGMRARGWGRIVAISSLTGQRGQIGQANYAAAKAGIIGFTKTVALELAGKGITANCIAPGFIETPMTAAMPPALLDAERERIPVRRLGQPEDIAAACAYLAGEEASFVTGQVLAVNGGQYM